MRRCAGLADLQDDDARVDIENHEVREEAIHRWAEEDLPVALKLGLEARGDVNEATRPGGLKLRPSAAWGIVDDQSACLHESRRLLTDECLRGDMVARRSLPATLQCARLNCDQRIGRLDFDIKYYQRIHC